MGLKVTNYYSDDYKELGLFPMDDDNVLFVNIELKDGTYQNLLGGYIEVRNKTILTSKPLIISLN